MRTNSRLKEPSSNGPPPPVDQAADEQSRLKDADRKLRKVIQANQHVSTLHNVYLHSAERAKENKKAWEAAAEGLQGLIRGFAQPMPLFDKPESKQAEPEAWRETAVDVLTSHGLPGAIAEKLDDAGFHTIGDLADWTTANNSLTAIAGVGLKKAEKIEQALESFWATLTPDDPAEDEPEPEKPADEIDDDDESEEDAEDDLGFEDDESDESDD
jgi:hypothetical protein